MIRLFDCLFLLILLRFSVRNTHSLGLSLFSPLVCSYQFWLVAIGLKVDCCLLIIFVTGRTWGFFLAALWHYDPFSTDLMIFLGSSRRSPGIFCPLNMQFVWKTCSQLYLNGFLLSLLLSRNALFWETGEKKSGGKFLVLQFFLNQMRTT